MTTAFCANETIRQLYGLNPAMTFEQQFSRVSIESILFCVVAVTAWTLESLFNAHRAEVTGIINNMKPHSARWYRTISLAFQYGFNLLHDSDQFDNRGKTDEEIEASKIVQYAAVIEQDRQLLIKAAKLENNDLAALNSSELNAFAEYINRVRDAGVRINVLSDEAEQLRLNLTVFYNPLVFNRFGERIDGTTETPVPDAIRNYLNTIEFDGTVVLAHLVDALQAVEGVEIPHIVSAAYRYGGIDWAAFDIMRRPNSGYMRIADENLTITYTPRAL